MDSNKDIKINDVKDLSDTKDGFYAFVFLKSEKLATAIYAITDFLSDNEPIKWKLRSRSLDMVFDADSLLKNRKVFLTATSLGKIHSLVSDIVVMLRVAYVGGSVSRMNFEVIKEEFENFAKTIEDKLSSVSDRKYISDDAVYSAYSELVRAGREPRSDLFGTGLLPASQSMSRPPISRSVAVPNRSLSSLGQKDIKKDSPNELLGLNSSAEKKSIRKEQIINFLKDKGWTGINDIAGALPDCGAKTVQRELLDMVARNILKKQGERRWSRYMLA